MIRGCWVHNTAILSHAFSKLESGPCEIVASFQADIERVVVFHAIAG